MMQVLRGEKCKTTYLQNSNFTSFIHKPLIQKEEELSEGILGYGNDPTQAKDSILPLVLLGSGPQFQDLRSTYTITHIFFRFLSLLFKETSEQEIMLYRLHIIIKFFRS